MIAKYFGLVFVSLAVLVHGDCPTESGSSQPCRGCCRTFSNGCGWSGEYSNEDGWGRDNGASSGYGSPVTASHLAFLFDAHDFRVQIAIIKRAIM